MKGRDSNGNLLVTWRMFLWAYIAPMALITVAIILGFEQSRREQNDLEQQQREARAQRMALVQQQKQTQAALDRAEVALQQALTGVQGVCAFRADLRRRIATTKAILRNNPEVIDRFGLTRAQARAQLRAQENTEKTLRKVECRRRPNGP